MAAAVEVVGLKEFRKALREAGQQWPKELREANKEAAEIAVPYVRRRAPKGPHEGGGDVTPIERSVRATATQRAGFVVAGGKRTPHAAVHQWGGSVPRRGNTGARSHFPAQHYLDRGVEDAADEVVEVYALTLDWVSRKAFPS